MTDKRNILDLPVNEVHYARNLETGKVFRIFSSEQLVEMIEAGRLPEDKFFVGIMRSPEGLGGPRDRKSSDKVTAQ